MGSRRARAPPAGAENDAEAEMEDADAGVDGGLGGGLPLLAEIGEKAGAERRGFVDELVAAIAVDADGRGNKEHSGRMAEAGEGGGEGAGGVDAALGDFALVVGGPAMGGEICAGEMDGGSEAFEALGVRNRRCGGGIPLELIGLGRGASEPAGEQRSRAQSGHSLRAVPSIPEAPERRKPGAGEDGLTGLILLSS